MIPIKSKKEIEVMSEAGRMLSEIVKELKDLIKPGVTTNQLNEAAENLVFKFGGDCSFKNYKGFPECLCTSINEEIVHGVPSERKLKEGDIVSLDMGFAYKDFHSDMAVTIPVGEIDTRTSELLEITRNTLDRAIEVVKPGNHFGDVSNAIQSYVEKEGFNVIKELCGHGIGREVHQDPQILNFGEKGTGEEIQEGMAFCIEPMVSIGSWRIKQREDGLAYITQDDALSAHFEHTVAVTKHGCEVLTEFDSENHE